MKGKKEFEFWRAEEIAKVYLLNSGLVTLVADYDDELNFLAIRKKSSEKKMGVVVKATKYSPNEIKKTFHKEMNGKAHLKLPILFMYINYDKESGYFEILNGDNNEDEMQPLKSDQFKAEIAKLIGQPSMVEGI